VRAVMARRGMIEAAVRGLDAGVAAPAPRAKFGNKKVPIDGFVFDSKKESERYLLLKMRARLGEIAELELQPVFEIFIQQADARIRIGDFTADFRYWEHTPAGDVLRVEDVKSEPTKTEAYRLRKKLVEAIYGITVIEV